MTAETMIQTADTVETAWQLSRTFSLSRDEIAAQLNLSPGEVTALLREGRERYSVQEKAPLAGYVTPDGADGVEEAYQLRHRMGLSYREIAAQLGIPEGTVMSRLARGRKRHGITANYRHSRLDMPALGHQLQGI
jgi:DNA-directed RNA polymerase specialized sigma24 family protein